MLEGLLVMMLLAGLLLGLPVLAMVLAYQAKQGQRAQKEAQRLLEGRLFATEQRLYMLERRASETARAGEPARAGEAAPTPAFVPPTPTAPRNTELSIRDTASVDPAPRDPAPRDPAPGEPEPRDTQPSRDTEPDTQPDAQPTPPPVDMPPPRPMLEPATPLNWENLIGVRLFAWLGGIALFLGGAFFLQYSIQHDLVSPPVRVAVGLGVGALALLVGDRLRARANWASEALSGAGVGILYASLFAARALYHLLGTGTAFAGMGLVTATACALAVRRGSFLVALLGLLGGMATPYLLSTGEDRPLALFGYIALLDVAFVAVAALRGWHVLSLLGVLCSALIMAGWSRLYLTAERVPYAFAAMAVIAALYGAGVHFASLRGRRAGSLGVAPRSALNRWVAVLAALVPLGFVIAFSSSQRLAVSPWLLALYVTMLCAGAAWVSAREAASPLLPAAVLLGSAALSGRVDGVLFPEQRLQTLAAFVLLPLAAGAWALMRPSSVPRSAEPDPGFVPERLAAALSAVAGLIVVLRALDVEPAAYPVAALLLFAALHAALLVALAARSGSGIYLLLGSCTLFAAVVASTGRYHPSRVAEFALAFAVPALASWAAPLVHPRLLRDVPALLAAAGVLPAYFLLAYGLLRHDVAAGPLGVTAVAAAGLTLFSWHTARRRAAAQGEGLSESMVVLFGAISLGFISAAVPILVGREWLTISWALEAAALCWLHRRVAHRGLLLAIALLCVAVSLRLAANPALWTYHPRSGVPILNFYLYTFGVPIAAFLLGARWLSGAALVGRVQRLLQIAGIVLAFCLLNVEIADVFSSGETPGALFLFGVGDSPTFELRGSRLSEDMTYSLAWGAFALTLLGIGISRRALGLRIGALGVLTLTLLKVTLHDLWQLGGLYRVGSLIGVAFALLLVSFLTQRLVLKQARS